MHAVADIHSIEDYGHLSAPESSPLERWLGIFPLKDFLKDYYLLSPYASTTVPKKYTDLVTWDSLSKIFSERPNELDLLIVRDGKLVLAENPSNWTEAKYLISLGCSLIIKQCEQYNPELRNLTYDFNKTLQAKTTIQIYATPANHYSFGWYYDTEDIFILQTAGSKDYYLKSNNIDSLPMLEDTPTTKQHEKDSQNNFIECTLVPGDWLYIPAGYWRKAIAREDSLSISIGVY